MKPLPQVVSDHVDFLTDDFFEFDLELPDAASNGGEARQFGLVHALDLASEPAEFGLSQAAQAPDVEKHGNGPADLPDGDGPSFDAGADIVLLEAGLLDAKGGKGGPSGGGGDTSGGGTGGLLTNYLSGDGDGDAGYDIRIEFKGSDWTVDLQQSFIQAADYFTTVITDDIGGGGRFRGIGTIDDLYVSAELKFIDGAGGILGQAGPTAAWSANSLTAAGQMQFDTADAQKYFGLGLWDDIVTHEMMHVLGFGTLWEYNRTGLVDKAAGEYYGTAGVAAYNRALGLVGDNEVEFIPVETDGGSGTAGGHWDDATLLNELMTGYINDDGTSTNTSDNYLSSFSVMSLADLGYVVDQALVYDDGVNLIG